MEHEKLVIAGSGPAGGTAAVYAARAGLAPLVLAGNLPGGLLTQTSQIENFPGFPDGIGGFDLVSNIQSQAERFGARFEYDAAIRFELSPGGIQHVTLESGAEIGCDALILALGANPRYLGIPGEERLRNHGVSACATCDGAFFKDFPVAVVGGGDSAMEEALFLSRYASIVHVIHRRDTLRASQIMAERALSDPKLSFHWNTTVSELVGEGELEALKLHDLKSGGDSLLPCRGYFCALGHTPNTELLRGILECDAQGYIRLAEGTSATSCAGVFAAGDCADPRYRQAIVAAGSGCRAAMDAERYLAARG